MHTPSPAIRAVLLGVALWAIVAGSLPAQERARVTRRENFRKDPSPDAVRLGAVEDGAEVPITGRTGSWMEVTIEGWIWAGSVRPDDREGHDVSVAPSGGENLRAEPNGTIVARLVSGALLDEIERQSGWVHVRRTGWMFGPSLEPVAGVGPASSPPLPPPRQAGSPPGGAARDDVGLDRAVTRDSATVFRTPDGPVAGTLAADVPVKILARSGGWVRVQAEGWVREDQLKSAAPGVLVGVSAAELRSRPREFEGKLVQWTVRFIAVQSGKELRPEIPEGRPWVLARGPLPEAGFVYLVVNDEQLAQFQRLSPLAEVLILGRVRAARSRYAGNPVLDVVEMSGK